MGFLILVFLISSCLANHCNSDYDCWADSVCLDYIILAEQDSKEFFNYAIPSTVNEEDEYVYVANPECSVCISYALACYQSFIDEQITGNFMFLLKSEYVDLFNYYAKKELESLPLVLSTETCDSIEDGLYLIKQGKVVKYFVWQNR